MKRIFGTVLTVVLVVLLSVSVFANGISVTLNGSKIDFADQDPVIVEGRTLVPLRAIFEALGATVEWNGETSTVTSQKGDIEISLTIGTNELYRNGEIRTLDVPAQIMNGRTMVPARAVAEAYGVTVNWDGDSRTVVLTDSVSSDIYNFNEIPDYSGSPFCIVNNNVPFFNDSELVADSFETYSELDSLGRCGPAYANIGKDILPTEERGSIGSVKPSGWNTIRYEFIDGRYLYNRCHLIGYQLSGENANTLNLITGTRYLNTKGMLPFENDVAEYIEKTENHVLYRVTPIFEGNNLLASGVLLEALSVEDKGDGIKFCVYCYNVQPGIVINYENGESYAEDGSLPYGSSEQQSVTKQDEENTGNEEDITENEPVEEVTYIGNSNTLKFHTPFCNSALSIKESNKVYFDNNREEIINLGYVPCKRCNP